MKMTSSLFIVSVVSLLACIHGASDRAHLLASKKVQNSYLVEGQDILVEYSLYNVGTAPALNVQLTDASFGPESFSIVAGRVQVKFERIAPGANVSHSIVVHAKQFGYFNFTAAEVSYLPSEESQDVQMGFTSAPGEGAIIPLKEYSRSHSSHLIDWAVYSAFLVPVLLVPFLMWSNINNKYHLNTISKSLSKLD